jgi:uncharacterized protein (TIRG00374 family)
MQHTVTDHRTPETGLESPFREGQIRKGLRYFGVLTVAGLALLFFYTTTPETLEALGHLEFRFFLIAIALSAVDLWIGGWRNHIFIRKIKSGVTPWLCFRANLANLFMGAMTPSQSGGGPAQLFILYRGGIPLPSGVSVSVINFLSTLVFFLVAATFAMVVVRERFSQQIVRFFIQYGFFAFAALFAFFIFALWRPDLFGRAVGAVARWVGRSGTRWGERLARLGQRAVAELDRYHASCTLFLREKPWLLLYSLVLTILMYWNKFTLAYFLMRGLGVEGDYLSMMALQTLLLFILYFSPSPGGSGIAELSTAALMSTLMPTYILPVFTMLYRFFLLYMPAALGAFVFIGEIKPRSRGVSTPPSYETSDVRVSESGQ